jgi:hypothetical protein
MTMMTRNDPMNKLSLKAAMQTVDMDEIERAAIEVGEEAVRFALEREDALAAKADADLKVPDMIQRQRDLDAALGDAIEVVARHRVRLGRRVCSRHDGETVRRIYELLRGLLDGGADGDPSFQ